jgi:hypothetical protein
MITVFSNATPCRLVPTFRRNLSTGLKTVIFIFTAVGTLDSLLPLCPQPEADMLGVLLTGCHVSTSLDADITGLKTLVCKDVTQTPLIDSFPPSNSP